MGKMQPIQLADWITITVRWVFLLGVTLGLSLSIGFSVLAIVILVLGALYNIFLTIAYLGHRPLPGQRFISIVIDAMMAYLLFYLTVPLDAEMGWVGILPLITAAVYFQYVGAIVMILLNLLVEGIIAWWFVPFDLLIPFFGALLVLYLIAGLFSAYASRRWLAKKTLYRRKMRVESSHLAAPDDSERRRAIFDLISELSSSLSYQRILDRALSLSRNTLAELDAPVEDLVSMVLFFTHQKDKSTKLEVVTSQLLLPADAHILLPGVSGLIGQAIEEGVPEISKNISTDPELSKFATLREYRSAYSIPLRSGLEAYGVMLFSHPDSDFFSLERREILDIIGKQFVIAIQNARLYQDLEQEKERMMDIQDDARKKMARDLHDGPTQAVAAIAMRVNFARRLMEKDPQMAVEELYKIEELARRTTKEIRHMLFTLRPLVLESQGLIAALEAMAVKMKDTYGQEVIIQVNTQVVDALEMGKQAIVFYLVEEAVNNARKHANAKHIWVNFRLMREGLSLLEIRDDGDGFDLKKVDESYEERGSLGMVNMRERTELLNGLLHIDSEIGRGTRVRIAIPLTEEAADRLRSGS